MKNVLVIGGTGFIGSHLIKRLVEIEDVEVYAVIRPDSSLGTKRLDKIRQLKYINSTVAKLKNDKSLPKFDVCFNLSAYGVDYNQQNINSMIEVNIKNLIDIIDFVYANKTELFINTGSCFEYGVNEEEGLSEEANLNPQSLYGASKMAGTIIGNNYAKIKGINMITVRPFSIYGPGEGRHKFIPQLIQAAIKNEKLDITECEQVRDYLYVDDLVDAYVKLANSNKIKKYNIYNICSAKPIKLKDFVDILCNEYEIDKSIFKFGAKQYRDNEVMCFIGDNSKIKNVINWESKTSLSEGIRLTMKWYRENWNNVL